jgi:hypothetical protein
MAHTGLKLLNEKGANLLILVPGAGLEPARTLPGPRDFKSRVSTNSTIRALDRSYENKTEIETYRSLKREGLSYEKAFAERN